MAKKKAAKKVAKKKAAKKVAKKAAKKSLKKPAKKSVKLATKKSAKKPAKKAAKKVVKKPTKKPAKKKKRAAAKRELIDTGTDLRYVRRDEDGTFKESVDVGRSIAADMRQEAEATAEPGQGDRGDQPNPEPMVHAEETATAQ